MALSFVGMQPPKFDVPLIELERAGGGAVDLYNECELQAVILKRARLVFDFVALLGKDWDVRGEWIQLQFAAGRIFALDADELALVTGSTAPSSSRILG